MTVVLETDTERADRLAREGHRDDGKLTDKQVADEARAHHIWLNAFACVSPSDEFLIDLGRQVLAILDESDIRDGFVGRSNVAYLRVNRS